MRLQKPRPGSRPLFVASFLAPAVLVYGATVIYPLFKALQFSTFSWRGVSARKKFVGADNFRRLAEDEVFQTTVKNNVLLLLGAGLVIVVLSLFVAHALRSRGRLAKGVRGVLLFPQMISTVVVAVLWQFILNPTGLLNAGLKRLGLGAAAHTWLGESAWALPSVGLAFVWATLGFYVLLFSAGLRGIPEETNEAAELDGSVGLHRFRKVTWPLLWSIKKVVVVSLVVNVMNVFALVVLMTRGGPDRASESMLTYLYEVAFSDSRFGYATAVAVGNFVVVMAISLFVLFLLRRDPTRSTKRDLRRFEVQS